MKPWFLLELGDAVTVLDFMRPQTVDLIVTDPAYESLEKHRAVGTTTRLTNDWFPIFRNERFGALMEQAHRMLKASSHFYFVCDDETSYVAVAEAQKAGFKMWQRIPWDKRRTPNDKGMGYHWRNVFEYVLFFEKGPGRQLNDRSRINFLQHPKVVGRYPTEKPVALWADLISNSTQPGDIVLDPFCGSGSSGEAALSLGRNYIGIDISTRAIDLCELRLTPHGERVTAVPRPKLELLHT